MGGFPPPTSGWAASTVSEESGGSVPVEETEFWKQMNKNRIGNLLAGARLRAGLTQGQLAKKFGIRQNMVSDYERGRRNLSPDMAARFSAVLHIKESHLKVASTTG
jgi:ribosome-binding protein aMBF1 (putative translation factor)